MTANQAHQADKLELRAVVGFSGKCAVYVVPQDRDVVLLSKGSTLADLSLYALSSRWLSEE